MCAGDFFGDCREGFINPTVILKCIFAKNNDMVFFAAPFADKLLAVFKGVLVEGFLNLALNQPIDLVLRSNGHAAMFPLLQKIGDVADDNIITLWSPPSFENCCPQIL